MLVGLTATPASAASTLITCTDLSTQKTIVLKAIKKSCNPLLATEIWHIQESDSSAHTSAGYANLRTCTSKRAQFDYQLIKGKCAKYQVSNDYWRSAALPAKPVITQATSSSHESVFLTLASESATNTDAPIAYYTITSSKGDVKKVFYWTDLNVFVSGLSSATLYTFTISATSVDGTSPESASSLAVTTQRYIAPVVAAPAAPAAPVVSCQNGGDCIVGDIGPGGGTVFYVALSPFECGTTELTTCQYLEADGAAEPTRNWAYTPYPYETVGSSGSSETATATAIGWGYRNTRAIILQGNTDTANSAAALADSYSVTFAGFVVADWFLPSKDELNQMCKWQGGITGADLTTLTTVCAVSSYSVNTGPGAAGFASAGYWSSTEESVSWAWAQWFDDGSQARDNKGGVRYVRPIRAFGSPAG